jgi:hypothetical protein
MDLDPLITLAHPICLRRQFPHLDEKRRPTAATWSRPERWIYPVGFQHEQYS